MKPLLSIVIPNYNQCIYISQAIKSIQLDSNLVEIIIMDGNSNDGSIDNILKYKTKCEHIVIAKDKGQSDALNKGFALATGDYMAFMNADDYYLPNGLNAMFEFMLNNDADIVCGGQINLDENNKMASITIPEENEYLDLSFRSSIFEPACIWKRNVWEQFGPFDINKHYVFGWEFLTKASKHIKFLIYPKVICVNRIHKERKTNDNSMVRRDEILNHVKMFSNNYWSTLYSIVNKLNEKKIIRYNNLKFQKLKKILYSLYFPSLFNKYSYSHFITAFNTLHPNK